MTMRMRDRDDGKKMRVVGFFSAVEAIMGRGG